MPENREDAPPSKASELPKPSAQPPTADDVWRALEQSRGGNALPVEFLARVIWQESRLASTPIVRFRVELAVRTSGRRNASPKRNARADAALQNRQDCWGLCVESSDRYREFARECLAMAQTIQDERARAVLSSNGSSVAAFSGEAQRRERRSTRLIDLVRQFPPLLGHLFQYFSVILPFYELRDALAFLEHIGGIAPVSPFAKNENPESTFLAASLLCHRNRIFLLTAKAHGSGPAPLCC